MSQKIDDQHSVSVQPTLKTHCNGSCQLLPSGPGGNSANSKLYFVAKSLSAARTTGSVVTACSGMRCSAASSKNRSIPAGEKMSSTLVGCAPGFEGWWTTPRGTTTNDPAGAVIVRVPTRIVSSPSKT